MAKTIYRYELPKWTKNQKVGYGAYSGEDHFIDGSRTKGKYFILKSDMGAKHNNSSTYPTAYWDMQGFSQRHYCACPTKAQLTKWFVCFNRRLKALGYNIVEYKVKTYTKGKSGKQCSFLPKDVISSKVIE
jgi:hypothetical protein